MTVPAYMRPTVTEACRPGSGTLAAPSFKMYRSNPELRAALERGMSRDTVGSANLFPKVRRAAATEAD